MVVVSTRLCIAIALAAIGCNGAGELHPFASGPGGGAADGSGGELPTQTTSGSDDAAESGGGTAGAADTWDGELDFVYVRCRRTTQAVTVSLAIEKAGDVTQMERTLGYADIYDRLPTVLRMGGSHVAPCDLVYRAGDGSEEILYDCSGQSDGDSSCAALDPAVSHDGRYVAFSVARGAISYAEMKAQPALVDPEADGGEERWYDLPNPRLDVVEAQLFVYDLEAGELTALPHEEGVLDVTPAFLSTGRLAFASSRAGLAGTVIHYPGSAWDTAVTTSRALQLYTMDRSGRDVAKISPHAMTLDAHPFQLADGRIAHVSWQAFGMLPYRYDNGSWGTPGAISSGVHLQAIGPWGTHLSPLFGQHTHISHGAEYTHVGAHRITQSGQGTIWFSDAAGSAGAGTIYAFAVPGVDIEGPGPADVGAGDVFRPADLFAPVPWAGRGTNFAGPVPDPPVQISGYADPLLYRGFVRDPEALPDGALALSWAKGGCSDVGARHEEVFGDLEPPLTSGSGAFTSMNVMAWSGLDTPGCDAGIYVASTLPVEHPSGLELLVDTTEFHEIMPRAAIPYAAVHGVSAPAQPDPEVAQLEPGSPFGEIAVSSMLLRETRSADGHPFNGLLQWATQGTDTADYDDAEICGVRLLAVQPNPAEDPEPPRSSTGHRMLVLGEVPVRRNEGVVDPLGMPDTSFRARVPADVPLVIQGIDCEGRTLNTSQTPFSLRPGEQLVCTGCHQRSDFGLPFEDVAAAIESSPSTALLGGGSVRLLAGEQQGEVSTRELDGWGIAFEFERDVLPILERRCVSCHESAAPEAGLALDVPGLDPGSTWWTLAADTTQTWVPVELRAPSRDGEGPLRKPQLSKYVRFMSARGSQLYWKAVGERTDGRTDDQFDAGSEFGFEDVDFGPEHSTEVTPEEAGVLARWIDAGAAAGQGVLQDTTPPTLTAAALGQGADGRLAIGTVDVGSGIDPTSLELCLLEDGGGCTIVPAPPAHEAGTVEVATPDVDEDREVRISVRDRAGNETAIVRTVHALAGAFNQGAPGASHDTAASDTGDDGSSGTAGGSEGGDGCSCRSSNGVPSLLGLLLVLLPARRRRITRGRRGSCSPRRSSRPRRPAPAAP